MVRTSKRGRLVIAAVAAATLLAGSASAQSVARGRILFLRCSSCHDISSEPSAKIGPNLKGVVGRRAGSLAGFTYSPALKAQTFVWDAAHLDRWLQSPSAVAPGTAMAFAGLPSESDRQAIIAYLEAPTK